MKTAFATQYNPYLSGYNKGNIVNQSLLLLSNCHVVKFMHFILTPLPNLELVQQLSSELPKP